MDKILGLAALLNNIDNLSEEESFELISLWRQIFGNSLGPAPKTVAELVSFCTM